MVEKTPDGCIVRYEYYCRLAFLQSQARLVYLLYILFYNDCLNIWITSEIFRNWVYSKFSNDFASEHRTPFCNSFHIDFHLAFYSPEGV